MAAETADSDKPILLDHLVGFIDILGFRGAVANPTLEVQGIIRRMLEEVKAAEQNFKIEVKPEDNGKQTTFVKPAICSFSDHMVVAFNYPDFLGSAVHTYQALMSIRSIANAVANRAREFDCLIRGAVTIGPLYHESGLIFGQGLVTAYDMESCVARYPRIIVDDAVMEGAGYGPDAETTMFRDDDGRWCLDYMTAYLETLNQRFGSGPSAEGCTGRRAWALTTRWKARNFALEHQQAGRARAAENWDWFAKRFEKSMLAANPYLFSMDGRPITFPE